MDQACGDHHLIAPWDLEAQALVDQVGLEGQECHPCQWQGQEADRNGSQTPPLP